MQHAVLQSGLKNPQNSGGSCGGLEDVCWDAECVLQNLLYKHSGSFGFAHSQTFINNRIYKQSGSHRITVSENPLNA